MTIQFKKYILYSKIKLCDGFQIMKSVLLFSRLNHLTQSLANICVQLAFNIVNKRVGQCFFNVGRQLCTVFNIRLIHYDLSLAFDGLKHIERHVDIDSADSECCFSDGRLTLLEFKVKFTV